MKVVAFDIDGVLADFIWGFSRLAFDLGMVDRPYRNETVKNWRIEMRREHRNKVWDHIDQYPVFWTQLPTLFTNDETQDLGDFIADGGHRVIYVTSRWPKARVATGEWLRKHRMPEGHLFMTDAKVELLKGLGDDLVAVIEDKPQYLADMRDAGLPVVARHWLYNEHIENIHRVESIGEFVNHVNNGG